MIPNNAHKEKWKKTSIEEIELTNQNVLRKGILHVFENNGNGHHQTLGMIEKIRKEYLRGIKTFSKARSASGISSKG